MPNLVITYPKISETDFSLIQDIRKSNDPRYFNIVNPHITLIFGTEKLNIEELVEHIRNKTVDFKSFAVRFDSAKVIEDDSKTFFHTFLVPSTGYDEIIKLHDMLYTDELESELRHDIPFIPHIGIGTSAQEDEMTKLASGINAKSLIINGMVQKLSIVQFDGTKVINCEEVLLS